MTKSDILEELKNYGDERTKTTLMKHGAREPFFGVKAADLKKILKKTKKNHELALALYDTNNSDAMYLAGLMADETQMTKAHLEDWVSKAYWYYLSEFTVPWVASETDHGFELGLKWIESEDINTAAAGWATLAWCTTVKEDDDIDIDMYKKLIQRVEDSIHDIPPNRIRYAMNTFVIYSGVYVKALTEVAKKAGKNIGKVTVDMGETACKVPLAFDYIVKQEEKGRIGKKRKTARC